MTCMSATPRPGKPNLSGSCDIRTGPTGTQQPSVLDEAEGCSLSSRALALGCFPRRGLSPDMPADDDERRADEREHHLGRFPSRRLLTGLAASSARPRSRAPGLVMVMDCLLDR